MKKNLIYFIVLALLGAVFFIPGVKDNLFPVAEIECAVKVEDKDYDVVLKGVNVPSTNLKNLRGKKLMFLSFWGTWCAPCREEWPSIEALYQSKKDDMEFVLIAMLDQEQDVEKFIKENNYTAPVYLAQSPIEGNILPKVYPTTFILDPSGRIISKETSTKDWNAQSVHDFLAPFLK